MAPAIVKSLVKFLVLAVVLVVIAMSAMVVLVGPGNPKGTAPPNFPWPPPRASARIVVPNEFFFAGDKPAGALTMGDVDRRLRDALNANGYFEHSYFAVPGGFALACRLERIYDDGRSMGPPERWQVDVPPLHEFSLEAYLRALFLASPGYYRVIVLIVTPEPFPEANEAVDRAQAMEWIHSGANQLPSVIGGIGYSAATKCTAMIYEFRQTTRGDRAVLSDPSLISGEGHLKNAKLWNALESRLGAARNSTGE